MSAKPEAKEKEKEAAAPAAEKPAPAAEKAPAGDKAAPVADAAPPAAPSKLPLIAAIAAIVLAPALSWGVAQFVLLPKLEKKLSLPAASADATASSEPAAAAAPSDDKDAKAKAAPPTYQFENVVVNLAGTMGTRYLKTTFIVTGSDAALPSLFETNKARMTDVTLNVLSALTLAELEEPGSRNVLREKLISAYNEALGRKVADQVYFSDFVVQ
jgi:flagellar FliL protein